MTSHLLSVALRSLRFRLTLLACSSLALQGQVAAQQIDPANRGITGAIMRSSTQSELNLAARGLSGLPAERAYLANIQILRLGCNEQLLKLPGYFSDLPGLLNLDIDNGNGCEMRLDLSDLRSLPKNLLRLNLSGALAPSSSLPIASLGNLEVLDISKYYKSQVPNQIYGLRHLKSLRMDYMDLRSLSSELSSLRELEFLYLNGNLLRANDWPDLNSMKSLKLVELGNNKLTKADQELIRSKFAASTRIAF